MRTLLLGVVLLALTLTPAHSQTSTSQRSEATASNSEDGSVVEGRTMLQGLEPEVAGRGEMVTVSGEFPKSLVGITVELKTIASTGPTRGISAEGVTIREVGKSFSFVVPRTAPLGKYDVVVNFSQKGKTQRPFRCLWPKAGPSRL